MENTQPQAVMGLVIKQVNYGEGDRIVTLLTQEHGRIAAVAKGARSYKSKLAAGCQMFCWSRMVLKKRGDLYTISAADPEETFYSLRERVERVALATYFCDLLSQVGVDAVGTEGLIPFALNSLYLLSKSEEYTKMKAAFELRLMAMCGFAPNLNACAECGSTDRLERFSVQEGGVFCDDCREGMPVQSGTLQAMRYIVTAPDKRVYAFKAENNVLEELAYLAEQYSMVHLERRFRSLDYFKKLVSVK